MTDAEERADLSAEAGGDLYDDHVFPEHLHPGNILHLDLGAIDRGGLRIETTIDPTLQAEAEAADRAVFTSPAPPRPRDSLLRFGAGDPAVDLRGRNTFFHQSLGFGQPGIDDSPE